MSSREIIYAAASSATPAVSYWKSSNSGANSGTNGPRLAIDSSGNFYLAGYGYSNNYILKLTTTGTQSWAKQVTDAGGVMIGYGGSVGIDTSGNVYVGGTGDFGGGTDYATLEKYSSAGAITWQKKIGGSGQYGGQAGTDSSGNMYLAYTNWTGSTYNMGLLKVNTSGTTQWQRQLTGSTQEEVFGMCADASGNSYITGYTYNNNSGGAMACFVAKYNTSGTFQWSMNLDNAGYTFGYNCFADASGNVYVAGDTAPGTTLYTFWVAKYTSAGALSWQRQLTKASGNMTAYDVTADASGNVYVCGYDHTAANSVAMLAKYTSAGVLSWQRTFTQSGVSLIAVGVAVDTSSNMYVNVVANSGTSNVFKLPVDGTKTGTYSSIVYAASTYTAAAGTLASGSSTLSSSTLANTVSSTTYTGSNKTITTTVTAI